MVDRKYANPEARPGVPAAMLFKYTFPHNFLTISEGFIKKFNWENRSNLTTVDTVQQLDDDRVLIWRRADSCQISGTTWERIVINR